MSQQNADNGTLRRLAIQGAIYAGTFLGGALLAFLYSYIPLHNAKNWKINYLEERLVVKDAELESYGAKLHALEIDSADKPDSQTFKLLQDELVTADKTVKNLERKVAKLQRRTKELEKSRNHWKSRQAQEEAARLAAESALKGDGGAVSVPAAIAETERPIVSNVTD